MKSQVHAKGSYSESISKSNLSEILSLVPDNTNGQISPRNLRDALFSIWEGSPIKFTYVESIPYIGVSRPDTKLKFFIGKSELRGKAVMSVDLLNSDIDIFLYNNKLDDVDYQDFKMAILAGIDERLWKLAPTIEVKSVKNELEISINNRNGEINLNSSKSISINSIKWPSENNINDMVSNPQCVDKDDLGIFLVDGKFIEFKRPNKFREISFTDKNPTQIDIGGIKAGSTFKDVPISELIRQILYPYLPPKVEIEFLKVGNNNSIERDHINDVSIDFKISILRRSENLESSFTRLANSKTTIFVKENEVDHSTGGPHQFEYQDSIYIECNKISSDKIDGEFILSMDIKDVNGEIGSASEKINFVYPYFYGFCSIENFSPDIVSSTFGSLYKIIDIKSNQSIPVIGSGHFCLAYPKVYGPISSINGKDIDKTFDFHQVKNIHSVDGKWGSVEYIVYFSKDVISVEGIPSMWNIEF